MTKYDSHTSRAAAIDQEEVTDEFYRPVTAPSTRAPRVRELAPSRNLLRTRGDAASKDTGNQEDDDAFLRARRRVAIRRRLVPESRNGRIAFAAAVLLGLALLVALGVAIRNFLRDDPRFRINSGSNIQILGNSQLTRQELLSVFGSDIGRNVFFIPLGERRTELEKLPWVGHATVMRLLPNQLRVSIVERVPIAFLRSGATIGLVDGDGVLLAMPPATMAAKHYSFPVVTGISAEDPLSVRAARMRLYQQFVNDLDSSGEKISEQLSEVDISDPEDIRAVLPEQGSDIVVHFGDSDFLNRYRLYRQHLPDWRRQYPHLAAADLRFDNQVVLEMAKPSPTPESASGKNTSVTQVGAKTATSKPSSRIASAGQKHEKGRRKPAGSHA